MLDDEHEYIEDDSTVPVDNMTDVIDESSDTAIDESSDTAIDESSGAAELNTSMIIAQLEAELVEARDSTLRAQAEAINTKNRAEKELEKARKFALDRFVNELLPVIDDMERALAAAGKSSAAQSIVEGVELTLKNFMNVLCKNGVESIDPMNEPFDPKVAQAVSIVENAEVEPNTVITVMQKGYQLNGRLVRPAMVTVSKTTV